MLSRRYLYLFILVAVGLLAFVGVLSFTAQAQTPGPSTGGPVGNSPATSQLAAPAPPDTVLYDQYNYSSNSSYTSQNFEAEFDGFDSFIADDFSVPVGQKWEVSRVDAEGDYFEPPGPADSFNVFFYTNAITLPGTLITSRVEMTYTNVMSDFYIIVSPTVALEAGKYWVSVQANQDYATEGQWGWMGRYFTSNNSAAWQNPGGAFGHDCTTWGQRISCIPGHSDPDQVYRLVGKVTYPRCEKPAQWVTRSSLPITEYGAGVATDGKYAYVFGGYSFTPAGDITQTLRYDPDSYAFTSLSPIPRVATLASALYSPLNNKIYVFGGEKVSSGEIYSTTLVYNITSNTWISGAPMPDTRAYMASGYDKGKIYLAGGLSAEQLETASNQLWVYDVTLNSWATKTEMPGALFGPASAVIDGKFYVIAGRDATGSLLNTTYIYDIASDTWTTGANALNPVYVPGSAVSNGRIWLIGGGTPFLGEVVSSSAASISPNALTSTQVYTPVTNSWAVGPVLNFARSFGSATSIVDIPIIFGGYNGVTTTGETETIDSCRQFLPPVLKK